MLTIAAADQDGAVNTGRAIDQSRPRIEAFPRATASTIPTTLVITTAYLGRNCRDTTYVTIIEMTRSGFTPAPAKPSMAKRASTPARRAAATAPGMWRISTPNQPVTPTTRMAPAHTT